MPATNSFADYQIIRDQNITLDAGPSNDPSEETLHFTVPSNMVISNSRVRRPILAFKYRPFEDSRLFVSFDSQEILDTSFDVSHTRTYWESVNLTSALSQFSSPVDVRFVCTQGRIRLADIIIWYQVTGQV